MYEKDGITYPRCTEIIKDCTNSSDGLIQWAANQTVEWIRENCHKAPTARGVCCELDGGNPMDYCLRNEQLDLARFNFRETSQVALDVGSEVHAAIEAYLKREMARSIDGEGHFDITDPVYAKLSKQAIRSFNAFNAWYKENSVTPISLEQTVWGDRWAGTLDFYGYYKEKLYVIDWKTSKKFYPEMRYQVAAYRSVSESHTQPFITESGTTVKISRSVEGCGVLMLDKETGMPKFKDTSKTYESDLAVFNKMVELYYLRHPKIRKRFEGGK